MVGIGQQGEQVVLVGVLHEQMAHRGLVGFLLMLVMGHRAQMVVVQEVDHRLVGGLPGLGVLAPEAV